MTQAKSTTRLILYILIQMLTTFSAGFVTLNTSDSKEVTLFAAAIIMSGLVVARSYLDQSESLVPKP